MGEKQPAEIPRGGRTLDPEEQAALRTEMADIIQHSRLFRSLSDESRDELLRAGYVLHWHVGDTILTEGDAGDAMFLVLQGEVRVQTTGTNGQVTLATLSRGACLGEVSLLTNRPRTATVTAQTEVNAVRFAHQDIELVLQKHPEVRRILESLVEGRAKATINKIVGT